MTAALRRRLAFAAGMGLIAAAAVAVVSEALSFPRVLPGTLLAGVLTFVTTFVLSRWVS
jgi:hypothetical protein